jgi:DNA-binding transcriptional regulator YhcF (GntR family)
VPYIADPDDEMLSTAKVAAKLGVAPATITRLYEPVAVAGSGRRYYTLRSIRAQQQKAVAS